MRIRLKSIILIATLALAAELLTALPVANTVSTKFSAKSASAATIDQPNYLSTTYPPKTYGYFEHNFSGTPNSPPVKMSDDGRFLIGRPDQTLDYRSAMLYDRDGDSNGILDDSTPPEPVDIADGMTEFSLMLEGNISADGNVVSFTATDGSRRRVYARTLNRTTRALGPLELISADSTGTGVNGYGSSLSSDGRLVAFVSLSAALSPIDTNGSYDVYMKDRVSGVMELISVNSAGQIGVGADENNYSSYDATVSSDGTQVAFTSYASNLVPGDTNETRDIFVRNLTTSTTIRQDTNDDGSQVGSEQVGPSDISANGRYVTFGFDDQIHLHDRDTDNDSIFDEPGAISTTNVSVKSSSSGRRPSISQDGRYVAYQKGFSTTPYLAVDIYDRVKDAFISRTILGREL